MKEVEINENAVLGSRSRRGSLYSDIRLVVPEGDVLSSHSSPIRSSIAQWVNSIPKSSEWFPNEFHGLKADNTVEMC